MSVKKALLGTKHEKIDLMVEELVRAKRAYYEGTPFMSDADFDALEDELKKVDPENEYFDMVGYTPTSYRKKIKHPVKMRSMQKVNTVDEFNKWVRNSLGEPCEFIVEPKIDGASMTICYENGIMQYAATRGDGEIGQDVTGRMKHVPGVPHKIKVKERVEVRGEIYIPKKNTLANEDEPLRNIAVGILNRKSEIKDCKHLCFVAYDVVGMEFKTVDQKLKFLGLSGFDTFTIRTFKTPEDVAAYYDAYLKSHRDAFPYETDGIIVQPNDISISKRIEDGHDHHPKWATAWKPPAEKKETELLGIDWRVTRLGVVAPTAVFKPIDLMGVSVKRATLHNLAFINQHYLNRGNKILVSRAGDVIPKVLENITIKPVLEKVVLEAEVKYPHQSDPDCEEKRARYIKDNMKKYESMLVPNVCPSCGHKLTADDVHLRCTNTSCEDRQLSKIVYWVTECELDQVSESTVDLLFKAGVVKKIADLYSVTEKDLTGIKGLGESKIANLLKQIEKARSMTAVQLIDRLGIPSVGEKALKKLGITNMDEFRKFSDTTYAVGISIVEWKKEPENMSLVEELERCLTITAAAKPLSGKMVCFTGSGPAGRKELAARAARKGWMSVDSVTKDLDLLVCDDVDGTSSKLKSARKHGVKIMTYEEFFK